MARACDGDAKKACLDRTAQEQDSLTNICRGRGSDTCAHPRMEGYVAALSARARDGRRALTRAGERGEKATFIARARDCSPPTTPGMGKIVAFGSNLHNSFSLPPSSPSSTSLAQLQHSSPVVLPHPELLHANWSQTLYRERG